MRITGGLVFDLEKGFLEKDLCTDGAVISSESAGETVIDASGCYVIPGLVDVHFHGCVGEDFSDATPEGLQAMADYELSEGVAYICPAGMTLPEEQLSPICKNAAAHKEKQADGAELWDFIWRDPFCPAPRKAHRTVIFSMTRIFPC